MPPPWKLHPSAPVRNDKIIDPVGKTRLGGFSIPRSLPAPARPIRPGGAVRSLPCDPSAPDLVRRRQCPLADLPTWADETVAPLPQTEIVTVPFSSIPFSSSSPPLRSGTTKASTRSAKHAWGAFQSHGPCRPQLGRFVPAAPFSPFPAILQPPTWGGDVNVLLPICRLGRTRPWPRSHKLKS